MKPNQGTSYKKKLEYIQAHHGQCDQLYANGEKIDELVGANEDNLRKLF